MANSAANFIRNVISKNKVAVFSKSYCGFCKLAKEVLTAADASQKVVELDLRPDGVAIQTELTNMTGQATVPQVFIDQVFIGGGTDVEKLYKSGKLKDMVSNTMSHL